MPSVHDRTWQCLYNYGTPSNSIIENTQSYLWSVKAWLTGQIGVTTAANRWTCVGSSDGVTGALDGVDRLGAAFDASKFISPGGIYNDAISAKTWIVLRSPAALGTVFEICLAVVSSNTLFYAMGKGSGHFSGGNANTLPALGNAEHTGGLGGGAGKGYQTLGPTQRINCWLSNRGDFLVHCGGEGTGVAFAWICFLFFVDPNGADQAPGVLLFTQSTRLLGTQLTNSSFFLMKNKNANAKSTAAVAAPYYNGTSLSSLVPAAGVVLTGGYPAFPLYLDDQTDKCIRGRLPDIYSGCDLLPGGTIEPAVGVPFNVAVDSVFLPLPAGTAEFPRY